MPEGRELHGRRRPAGVPVARIDVGFELDMHYIGQTSIAAPLPVNFSGECDGVVTEMILPPSRGL